MTDTNSSNGDFRMQALSALDVAVLKRDADGGFTLMEPIPKWWVSAFESAETFCDQSHFLEDFVKGAAEELWDPQKDDARILRSGIWEETSETGPCFFEAIASRSESGESVLIVSLADDQWQRQQAFVQVAHDESLSRRQLRKELEKKQILLQCIMHDLGSPLETVLTNLRHIDRHIEDGQGALKSTLHQAITQAERHRELSHSIAEIFAADIAGAKSDDDSSQVLDLTAVAVETVAACAPAATEKGITLCPFFGNKMKVVGDSLSLSRVVENLLLNAIQQSQENGTVLISFEKSDGFAICRIDDDGPGFNSEQLENLFQPFSQSDGRPGAAGLGLYFCKITVEIWGGSIIARNRAKEGACFEFRLPLATGLI